MPGLVPGIHVFGPVEIRRGWPGTSPAMTAKSLRIKPRLKPWLIRRRAAEFDAVVQAERAVMPEFELQRCDAPAAPARRARHFADDVSGRDGRDGLFERETAL